MSSFVVDRMVEERVSLFGYSFVILNGKKSKILDSILMKIIIVFSE